MLSNSIEEEVVSMEISLTTDGGQTTMDQSTHQLCYSIGQQRIAKLKITNLKEMNTVTYIVKMPGYMYLW